MRSLHFQDALLRCAGALLLCAMGTATAQAQGVTVAIGGALQDGNTAVWQRLVQLAGGPGACFSVFTAASGEPDVSAAAVAANLGRHGARGEHIRVGPRIAGQDVAAAVADPQWLQRVRACRGIYMTGGAQARLLDLLQPHGRTTPLLEAMREVWRAGGVVAGSSAGAAVQSSVVFRDAPDPLAVMKGRLREGQEWGAGLGFTPAEVIVDQHAVKRGRIARLLPLLQARGVSVGVAVEEDSAAVFRGSEIEVIGGRGVLIADLAGATRQAAQREFNLASARLHWLEAGDRFDLRTRELLPSPARRAGTLLQPLAAGHQGYHRGPAFYADILGDAMIVGAMARLVDSDQRELRGLAFAAEPLADDPAPDLGFEWRLWVDAGTRGWLSTQPTAYTLSGVRLDIVPVRVQRPLYVPTPPRPQTEKPP